MRTAAGELFDIDTALRPNGNSGLLVTSIDVVRQLPDRPRQQHRLDLGAPGADAGALVRRASSGSAPRFEAVRRSRPRGAARPSRRCAREVRAMREKVRAAHPVKAGRFDVKHSPGGMIDVEFAVQALVLPKAPAIPSCSTTSATSPCCAAPRRPGCLPAGVGDAAADAYRELRRAQHRARLDEQPTQVEPGDAGRAEQRRARALACRLRLTPRARRRRADVRSRGRAARPRRARSASASDRSALDWQPALALREPWRALERGVRPLSALHLRANLAGAAARRRARRVRARAAARRSRLAARLAADAARPAGPTRPAPLRRPLGRAPRRRRRASPCT